MTKQPEPHNPAHLRGRGRFPDEVADRLVGLGSHTKKSARRTERLAHGLEAALMDHGADGIATFVHEPDRWVDRLDRVAVVRTVELLAGATFAPYDVVAAGVVPQLDGPAKRPLTELELGAVVVAAHLGGWKPGTALRRVVLCELGRAGASAKECAALRSADVTRSRKGDATCVALPGTRRPAGTVDEPRNDARLRGPREVRLVGPAAESVQLLAKERRGMSLVYGGQLNDLASAESSVAMLLGETMKWAGCGHDPHVDAMSINLAVARMAATRQGITAAGELLGLSKLDPLAEKLRLDDKEWKPSK